MKFIHVLMGLLLMPVFAFSQSNLPACNLNENPNQWNMCVATVKLPDGSKFIGEVRNGKKHGKGAEYFSDGDRYVGEYKEDVADGFGTHYMKSGDIYVGYFKNNNYNGKGIYTPKSGSPIREGLWQDDKFIKAEKTNIENSAIPSLVDNLFRKGGFWVRTNQSNAQCQNLLQNEPQSMTFIAYTAESIYIQMRAGGRHPFINHPTADPRKVLNRNFNFPIQVAVTKEKPTYEIKVTEFVNQSRMTKYLRMNPNGRQITEYKKGDCINCAKAQQIAMDTFDGPEIYNWCEGAITN
jgi:hypothetical protein